MPRPILEFDPSDPACLYPLFGAQFDALMKQRNLTAKQAGEKIGIHPTNISKYRRGLQHPDPETLAKINEKLETDFKPTPRVEPLGNTSETRFNSLSDDGDLGPRLDAYVSHLVRTGRYRSRSEVLREGVRLVEEREKRLAALDAEIARGVADVEAGRVTPINEAFRRIREEITAMK